MILGPLIVYLLIRKLRRWLLRGTASAVLLARLRAVLLLAGLVLVIALAWGWHAL